MNPSDVYARPAPMPGNAGNTKPGDSASAGQFVPPSPLRQTGPAQTADAANASLVVSLTATRTSGASGASGAANAAFSIVPPLLPETLQGYASVAAQAQMSIGEAQQATTLLMRENLRANADAKERESQAVFAENAAANDAASTKKQYDPVQMGLKWFSNVLTLIGLALSVVVSIAAATVTCGAAGFLVGAAVFGLVSNVVQMGGEAADDAAKAKGEKGVGALTLGRGLAEAGVALAELDPANSKLKDDPAYREQVLNGLTMAYDMVISVATIAVGAVAGVKVAAKAAELGSTISDLTRMAVSVGARATEAITEVTKTLTDLSNAAITLYLAKIQVDADNHLAYKSYHEGQLSNLDMQFQHFDKLLRSSMENVLKVIEDSNSAVMQQASNSLAVSGNIRRIS